MTMKAKQSVANALRYEIDTLRELSEIERKAGYNQSTWQVLRNVAHRLEELVPIVELQHKALLHADRLCQEALPKFDWGRSALDSNAILLLNEAPSLIAIAIVTAEMKGGA